MDKKKELCKIAAEILNVANECSKSEWIPVSERLPDNDRRVLVSIRWDKNDTDLDEVSIAECWESDQWGNLNDKVTAWAELPAPYTESEVES